jgi:hypothetical protein
MHTPGLVDFRVWELGAGAVYKGTLTGCQTDGGVLPTLLQYQQPQTSHDRSDRVVYATAEARNCIRKSHHNYSAICKDGASSARDVGQRQWDAVRNHHAKNTRFG